jgi:hypothetical protein
MLRSLRNSLYTTAVMATPFLLSACGDDSNSPQQKFEIVLLPLLFFTVSLAQGYLQERRTRAAARA